MKCFIRAGPRFIAAGALAVMLAVSAQQTAAQSVFFAGFTQGCFFNSATSSSCTPGNTASVPGGALTFTGGQFSGTTTNGVLAFDPVTWWTHTGVIVGASSLGTLALGTLPGFSYTGWNFVLQIVFSDPGAYANVFLATLTGAITHVRPALIGDIDIVFGPGQSFGPNGNHGVQVSSHYDLLPEQSHAIGGQIVTSTPEPITMVLLGTGLAGVGMLRRRRNRIDKADLI